MYACFVEAACDRPGLVSDVDVDVDVDVGLGWWCVDGEIPEDGMGWDGMGWHQDVKVCSEQGPSHHQSDCLKVGLEL